MISTSVDTPDPPRCKPASYPGLTQTAILFTVFFLWFTSGVLYHYIPAWLTFLQGPSRAVCIIGGGAGMFACLILFLISAVVARLH